MRPRRRSRTPLAAVMVAGVLALGVIAETSGAVFFGTTDTVDSSLEGGDWYRFTSVAAGREFACTSNVNDEVWCWGKGNDGQLGNGSSPSYSSDAVQVVGVGGSGYLTGITEVVAGEAFACGLQDDGEVFCWGRGDKAQLGNNSTSSSNTPVQVVGLGGTGYMANVVDIAAGQKHACAVTASGAVYCWGENNVSQLGNGGGNSLVPVQVGGVGGSGTLSDITSVGSGMDHTCAIGSDGAVYCWGEGSLGQLGNGSTVDQAYPVQVVGVGGSGTLSGIESVDGGDTHTCVKASSGEMYCWGDGSYGQLAPASVVDGTAITKTSAGDVTPDQFAYGSGGFGSAFNTATVGRWMVMDAATSAIRSEAILVGVDDGDQVTAQMWNGSSWSSLGTLATANYSFSTYWGAAVAYESQSGDAVLVYDNGTTGNAGLSYKVWNGLSWSGSTTITTPLSGEPFHMRLAAAPDSDEMVLVVANTSGNNYALVWNGSSWGNSVTLHSGSDNPTDATVAYEQSSGDALVIYGKISDEIYYRTWDGSSWSGEAWTSVASGTSTSSSSRWSQIAADPTSDRIIIGVHNQVNDGWVAIWDGSAWGNKQTVTTGGSGTNYPWLAVAFEGMSGHAIAAYGESGASAVAYRTWSSGGGWSGESTGPGLGATPRTTILWSEPGSDSVMLGVMDSAEDTTFAEWSGTAWGSPEELSTDTGLTSGQPFFFLWGLEALKNSPPASSSTPRLVSSPGGSGVMSGVEHIATGAYHTCASLSSGAGYCWGLNNDGQLGDNSTANRSVPTQIVGSGGSGTFTNSGILAGAHSTGSFSCATRSDPSLASNPARHHEEVWCWGRGSQGQLGNAGTSDSSYPVRVAGI